MHELLLLAQYVNSYLKNGLVNFLVHVWIIKYNIHHYIFWSLTLC